MLLDCPFFDVVWIDGLAHFRFRYLELFDQEQDESILADMVRLWVIGIYRDDSQIWGCVGGYAAYTPPNLGTSTAIPKEPRLSTRA